MSVGEGGREGGSEGGGRGSGDYSHHQGYEVSEDWDEE